MGIKKIIVENWITRKLPERGHKTTLVLVTMLLAGSSLYLNDFFNAAEWMPASYETVVLRHQYYRLWTSLFAHGDFAHIMSNLFLFVPFAYLLSHYFSLFLFPLIGFLLGGLINYMVVHYLGGAITIIGVSGVVYWMGAAWMTLSFLIDRSETMLARFIRVSGVSLILFFPTTFLPEVSYLSHFLGYVLGIISGGLFYLFFRKRFLAAEVIHEIDEDREYFDWENFSPEKIRFEELNEKETDTINKWLQRDHVARTFMPRNEARIFMVYADQMSLGFLQTSVSEGGLRIEPFIAQKKLLSRGLGSIIIRKFTEEFSAESSFIVELNVSNGAAIRAFKKAGFVRSGTMFATGGPTVLLTKERYS